MKVQGQGNLRTMEPAAKATIEGTEAIDIHTKMGRWEIKEHSDGSITVRAAEMANGFIPRLVVLPDSSSRACMEMR